jgi:type IV secretion system protein TrbL
MGSAAAASYQLGQSSAGASTIGAGIGGMARTAAGAMREKAASGLGLADAARRGRDGAWAAMNGGKPASGGTEFAGDAAPAWAQALRRQQDSRHRRQLAMHSLQQGDRGGASATPDIRERND